jgi:plastocyanin
MPLRSKPLRFALLAAVLALGAAFAVPALAAKVHSRTVKVGDFFFVRDSNHAPTVHVAPNTVVRWKFVGSVAHNVTVDSGPVKFHSHDMDTGTFSKKLREQGTYTIECTIHGFKMRLIVGKASNGDAQPKPAPPAPNPYGY